MQGPRSFGGAAALIALLALAGCDTLSPAGSFSDVAATVEARTGKQISWDAGQYEDPVVRSTIENLLAQPLTPETAVQIALINNRELQALYADIGVAQANLVQSGLWKNPIFDGAVTFPTAGGAPDYAFDLTLKLIDILYIPLRRRVAESELEEAKLRVTGQVMAVAGRTLLAFYDYVGQRQAVGVLTQALTSVTATVESGKVLRRAGNITEYEFELEVSQQVRVAAELALGQSRAADARERLNRLMGLTGAQTEWKSAHRLPAIPGDDPPTDDVERRAIEASLDLALARQRIITTGRRYRVVNITSIVPQLDVGGTYERVIDEKEAGPIFTAEIPLFDRGEARRASARMEIRRQQDEFTALAVRIRSFARLQKAQLLFARQTAGYYGTAVLPQSQRLVDAAKRQQNAMQIGIFELLQARERQIRAGQNYVSSLITYWSARARLGQILSGKLPEEQDSAGGTIATTQTAPGE
jgi:cobalt-zinc-cadmium efflux system outer membrane protein